MELMRFQFLAKGEFGVPGNLGDQPGDSLNMVYPQITPLLAMFLISRVAILGKVLLDYGDGANRCIHR